jgi:hypothetical protein
MKVRRRIMPDANELPDDTEDERETFDQGRHDQISDFTATPPYKVGLDPDSFPYDMDFPFPEDEGDPDVLQWCAWKGIPDPNEDSGVLWGAVQPYGLARAEAETRVEELLDV